jgi:thiamine-monophosphate kinase
MRRLADVGEQGLLTAIAARLGRGPGRARRGVLVGVGDDAALLAAVGPAAALTTDLLVEGVDFEWRWARPADVGHKAAAVNLSDLAAMGARPRGLLLSLALRPGDAVRDVLALVTAVHREGSRYGAPLVGGDVSATSGPLVISVTAVGELTPAQAMRRHRGRPGDRVLVSGTLGAAAAALSLLAAGRRVPPALARRQLRPEPRVALGLSFARSGLVRSCADVSDGLASDALHVAGPGCGVELDLERLPVARSLARAAARLGREALELALEGGEDFELVLAAAPGRVPALRRRAAQLGVPLTDVGEVVRGSGLTLKGRATRGARGFDHFSR